MSNIVLNTKTYSGSGIQNGVAAFVERSGGIAASFSQLKMSERIDTKIRGKATLDLPVVATEATSCSCPGTVLRVADANLQFRMDTTMTTAERTDFADRLKDLVSSAQFRAMIINLEVQG